MSTPDYESAIEVYCRAREYVAGAGLLDEVRWHAAAKIEEFDESSFLREAAWVVLCSGFREAVVRKHFNHVSLAYCDWESAREIVASYPACVDAAMAGISNRAKHEAIYRIALLVDSRGFNSFKTSVLKDPFDELGKLPFIGPITSWHLAKNLGLNVGKPDRHLERIAKRLRFPTVYSFFEALEALVAKERKVIDLLIWRYLADNRSARIHWL